MSPTAFCTVPLAAVGQQRNVACSHGVPRRQHGGFVRPASALSWSEQSWASRGQLPQASRGLSLQGRAMNILLAALAAASVLRTRRDGRSLGSWMKRRVLYQQRPIRSCLGAADRPVSNEGVPQWEFDQTNSKVFSQLAGAMRVVAGVFLVKALAVHGVSWCGTYLLHSSPGMIYSEIFGEMAEMFDYIFFSFFLWKAAADVQAIADSTGNDITFLMRAIAALLAFFKRLVIVGGILILKGVASTLGKLSDLFHLKEQGIAVQVAATPPFGLVPPAWCFPLGFVMITVFMVVFGRKSLWDDYGQIAGYMQPNEK